MKSRKQVWIAALCLCSAIAIAVAFTAHTTKVQAAKHIAPKSPTSLAQPAVYLAGSALRGALMDDDGPARAQLSGRTIFPPVEEFTLTPPNPAAGIDKTILTVRFPEAQAAKLASSIPMTLAKQNVILRRSPTALGVFVTTLDFNWQRFMEEQGQRKIAASHGRKVAIFNGRKYLRTETMQFVDPAQIQQALQSHHPIQFAGDILAGSPNFFVYPDHELMITNKAVVEDTEPATGDGRTYDQCLIPLGDNPGNPNGAWTFNTLMTAIACSNNPNCTAQPSQTNQQIAENMLLSMLNNFANTNMDVNTFTVFARPGIGTPNNAQNMGGTGLLGNWPVDQAAGTSCVWNTEPSACPSLPMAPVRLDAIVNRIDLGESLLSPPTPAGELRFVFNVTAAINSNGGGPQPCSNANTNREEALNIILEYNVPGNIDATTWATNWIALQTTFTPGTNDFNENYLIALNAITNQVVMANECTNGTSCISQIRTNEFLLAPGGGVNTCCWEQRQFQLNPGTTPTLAEGTIGMTPDPGFNPNGSPPCGMNVNNHEACNMVDGLADYVNTFGGDEELLLQTQGAAPAVPPAIMVNGTNVPFLGGSALQVDMLFPAPGPAFWSSNNINFLQQNIPTARIDVSLNTCNGCHGLETNTGFVQVANRPAGAESGLSAFLTGCSKGGTCGSMNPPCATSLPDMVNQNINGCTEFVTDPAGKQNGPTKFGDLLRRVGYLLTTCGTFNSNNQCTGSSGSDILLPFTNKPVGVH